MAAQLNPDPLIIVVNGNGTASSSSSEAAASDAPNLPVTPPNSIASSSSPNTNASMQSITDELKKLNEKMDKNNDQMMLMNQELIDIHPQVESTSSDPIGSDKIRRFPWYRIPTGSCWVSESVGFSGFRQDPGHSDTFRQRQLPVGIRYQDSDNFRRIPIGSDKIR